MQRTKQTLAAEADAYTIQIGTAFDEGQELVWTLISQEQLAGNNIIVPRPRRYRKQLAKLAHENGRAVVPREDVQRIIDQGQTEGDTHVFLSVKELMQPRPNFCPDGAWFAGLGTRAAAYRSLFAPAPVQFMISLRNPALVLSDALNSDNYPGFEAETPDPFALHWAAVLQDLHDHCPDTQITAWCAAQAPMIWKQILTAATRDDVDFTIEVETRLACRLMNKEGSQRLVAYLESRPNLSRDKRSRAIGLFLEKFRSDAVLESENIIPGWNAQKQDQIDAQYAADLNKVAQMEGVTLVCAAHPLATEGDHTGASSLNKKNKSPSKTNATKHHPVIAGDIRGKSA